MDRHSFVFSLLLIVSVTTLITFGSVIKAKNPNGEELEALLKRFHHQSNPDMKTDAQTKLQGQTGMKDQESEMSKRDDPVTLIPGPTTGALLEERVEKNPACGDFQIAICVENLSGYKWTQPSMYRDAGTELILRDHVLAGRKVEALSYGQHSPVSGVLVYYIEQTGASLAMWYYVSDYQNRWNVMVFPHNEHAGIYTYGHMRPISNIADNQWHAGALSYGLKYRVFMSTFPQALLKIEIFKSE